MTPRSRLPSAPRLLVVGLIVLGAACHRQPAPESPAPVAQPTPDQPQPSAGSRTAETNRPPARAAAPPGVSNGITVLDSMHVRYAEQWYHTIAFTLKTTVSLASGGEVVQTWHEAGDLPGRLRIDTDVASKTGVLYARDSSYSFAGGRLIDATPRLNELLVLAFDVYVQPTEHTAEQLRALGFDLGRAYETTWYADTVYVIGAARGDTVSKQFWVDRRRLLVVRMLGKTNQGLVDTRFGDYRPIGSGWIAAEVVQLVNGKRRLLEQYSDIRPDVTLMAGMFDPKAWR